MIPTPQDINPLIDASKFPSYRPYQWQGVVDVVDALDSGAKVVFLDAPTGVGKSLLAETVRSLHNKHASTPYLCTTLLLQDQMETDFAHAKVLKGRANYPTRYFPDDYPMLSGADCDPRPQEIDPDAVPDWLQEDAIIYGINSLTRRDMEGACWATKCNNCGPQPLCPYIVARDEAIRAPLCVTNTAYYLREANGPRRLSGRNLVIVDEADAFEDVILDTFTVTVPKWLLDDPMCPKPRTASKPEDIETWIGAMLPFLQAQHNDLERNKRAWIEKWGAKKHRSHLNTVASLLTNFSLANAETWLYEGPSDFSRKKFYQAHLRPTWIEDWVSEFVWDHATQWLLMSASFVSMDLTAMNLGLKPGQYAKVKVDYSFPKERRPIRYWPSQKPYTRSAENGGFDVIGDMARKIGQIAEWWPDERILVHTQSHARTEALAAKLGKELDRPVFSFTTSVARERAVEQYRETEGAMLVGAGLERGYDFKHDECRVNVLAKTPYPDLGNAVVAARLRSGQVGQAWFGLATTRSMTQSLGRGMRAETDWMVGYVLDHSFEDFLRGTQRKLVPPEVMEAVRFGVPQQREMVETT